MCGNQVPFFLFFWFFLVLTDSVTQQEEDFVTQKMTYLISAQATNSNILSSSNFLGLNGFESRMRYSSLVLESSPGLKVSSSSPSGNQLTKKEKRKIVVSRFNEVSLLSWCW
uniref:Uncharacterized protein n=1 Tax=Rhizophora mucronata TaxID=61149 RepID=A0A2P2KTR6_RHIMU